MPSVYKSRGIYPAPYTLAIGSLVISILFHLCICIILSETKILNLKEMEDRIQRLSVDLIKVPSKTLEMEHLETAYSSPAETNILRKSAEEILKNSYNFKYHEFPPLKVEEDRLRIEEELNGLKPSASSLQPSAVQKESASRDEFASVPQTSKIEVPEGRKISGAVTIPALKQVELYSNGMPDWMLPIQPAPQTLEPLAASVQPPSLNGRDTLFATANLSQARQYAPASVLPTVSAETGNYKSLTNDVDVGFSIYHDTRTGRQFFKVIITPKQGATFAPIPKDVLFAVDVSFSISNSELREARSALESSLRILNKDDRFNVAIFSTACKWLFTDFQNISDENVKSAVAFIERLPNLDMTDIYTTLNEIVGAIHELPLLQQDSGHAQERPCNIILISDGSPTTGITDVRKIVGDLVQVRPANTSIFTLDIGKRGNRYLLDLIAFESRGYSWVEENVKRGGFALTEFIRKYKDPLLLRMAVNYANLEEGDIYPRVLPNLYMGENIEIYGTCRPGSEVAMRIVGNACDEMCELTITKKVTLGGEGGQEIAREWATRKAYYLISRVALEGPKEEWLTEIERLREEFSINIPYSVAPGRNWLRNIFYKFP